MMRITRNSLIVYSLNLMTLLVSFSALADENLFYRFYKGEEIKNSENCGNLFTTKDRVQRIAYKVSQKEQIDGKCLHTALLGTSKAFFYDAKDSKDFFERVQFYDSLVLNKGLSNYEVIAKLLNILKNTSQFNRIIKYARICIAEATGDHYKNCANELMYALAYTDSDQSEFEKIYSKSFSEIKKLSAEEQFYFKFNKIRYYAFRNDYSVLRTIIKEMSANPIIKTCYSCRANLIIARAYYYSLQGKFNVSQQLLDAIDQAKLPKYDIGFLRHSYLEIYPFLFKFEEVEKITKELSESLTPPNSFANARLYTQLAILLIISEYIQNGKIPKDLIEKYNEGISHSTLKSDLQIEIESYLTNKKPTVKLRKHVKYIESRISQTLDARKKYLEKNKK